MSLLLEREPFADILTETLGPFWSRLGGRPTHVDWMWNPPRRQLFRSNEDIRWLCNVYLNAIFPIGVSRPVLDPIRREFSRSVVAWRRPLQKAYVSLALASRSAHWFTHALLRVYPPVDSLRQQLIVPGNNKIRILDRQAESVHGILKTGFSRDRFSTELAIRKQAESLELPVPRLTATELSAGWYQEQYVVGAPLNRLKNQSRIDSITARATLSLRRLAAATRQETSLPEYVDQLKTRIDRHLESVKTLEQTLAGTAAHSTSPVHDRAAAAADRLTRQILSPANRSGTIDTVVAHGDFQPANILVDADTFWIIDWEFAGRRQMLYDLLVFHSQSRSVQSNRRNGIAARLRDFVKSGWPPSMMDDIGLDTRPENSDRGRRRQADVFLLEELELRLSENTNRRFTAFDRGLGQLLDEIELWNTSR